jgi:hypothetical protein
MLRHQTLEAHHTAATPVMARASTTTGTSFITVTMARVTTMTISLVEVREQSSSRVVD